jgi:hypothetical protein
MSRHCMRRHRRTDRLAYSIARLAKMTDLSRSSLYEEIAAGRLVARKTGRRTIVTRADALGWLRSLQPMRQDVPLNGQPRRLEPELPNSHNVGQ